MNRKFLFVILAAALSLVTVLAAVSPQEEYIKKYSSIAVEEMYRSGVPASITLAQGLLESRYGQSELASKGKNHFGIKCHSDWKGKTMKADDDKKGECFRVYKSAEESFRDHSDFLRYRDRYKFLFDYPVDDYKAWANGLKKAGYATDPAYPQKLIDLIERYNLYEYDIKEEQQQLQDLLPESPLQLEEVFLPEISSSERAGSETLTISLSRQILYRNGVPFVYSMEGESYKSVAAEFGLLLMEILSFNDEKKDAPLPAGTIVYIERKKVSTPKGLDKYVVGQDGEDLHDICRRFAVRESSVRKMNKFKKGDVYLREGDTVILRKNR